MARQRIDPKERAKSAPYSLPGKTIDATAKVAARLGKNPSQLVQEILLKDTRIKWALWQMSKS